MNAFVPPGSWYLLIFLAALSTATWLVAQLVLRVWPGLSAARRHFVWQSNFVILAVCSVLAFFPARVALPILPAKMVVIPAPVAEKHELPPPAQILPAEPSAPPLLTGSQLVSALAQGPVPPQRKPFPIHPLALIYGLWLVGEAILVGRIVVGLILLQKIRRRSGFAGTVDSDGHFVPGAGTGCAVFTCGDLGVPLATGIFSRVIILPVAALQWEEAQLRATLLHEMSHLHRGDVGSLACAQLVRALYWFNPLVWLALKNLRAESELAADDAAALRHASAEDYAASLVAIVRRLKLEKFHPFPAVGMALTPQIESRLKKLLDSKRDRSALSTAFCFLATFASVLLSLALLIVRPVAAQDIHVSGNSSQTPKSPNGPLERQMIAAVKKGDATTVQKLIGQGVDPNKIQWSGDSLLFAVGSPEVAEILIQHGADPNTRNKSNDTVLASFSRNRGVGKSMACIVKVLLDHGADPNARIGELQTTALMGAHDGEIVDLLVEHGADLKVKGTSDQGILAYVGGNSDPSSLEALGRHGVPFDPKADGPTILVHASWTGNLPMIKWLLDHGVDPNLPGLWWKNPANGQQDVMTPLEAAVVDGRADAAKLLLEHGAKAEDQMINALGNHNAKIIALLWDNGARNISPLCYAISQGATLADVQKLLDQGSLVDPPEDKKITPLGYAAMVGRMDLVKLLIGHHANVNAAAPLDPKFPLAGKSTPLSLAASEGQDEIVSYLLQHGAKPDPGALYEAAENSTPYSDQRAQAHFEKTAQILIDAGALNGVSPEMAGLLLEAPLETRQGPPNPTVFKMLLDAGLNPESPMPFIVENGEKPHSVVGWFRETYQKRKNDPNSQTAQWATTIKPLLDLMEAADAHDSASSSQAPQSTDASLEQQMIAAVKKGDAVTVQKLIGQGIDPNKIQEDDKPLLFAAGSPEVAEILIQNGADPNARDKSDDTVLASFCSDRQAAGIVRVLLKHGADPNARMGRLKTTPLMNASDGEIVDLLVENGADLKAKDTEGQNVLIYTAKADFSNFEALLRHGVPFDPKVDGPAVLAKASWMSNPPLVKWLLEHGVDPNVPGLWSKYANGQSMMELPLESAAVNGELKAVKLLLEHGAKVNDPIMVTALNGHHARVVKAFWENGAGNISPLCYAISQGATVADVQKLLDQGNLVNPPEDKFITPLGEAAMLGRMDLVRLLVEHHADVNASAPPDPKFPFFGKGTPLTRAAGEGQDEIVSYLLQQGAKPVPVALYEAANNSTPYSDQRAQEHFEKTARILIDAGALNGISPEMAGLILIAPLTTRQGPPNPTVFKMLLDAGLSPELPMPHLVDGGEKPNSVIGSYREDYQKKKNDPDPWAAQWATAIKPLLDLMEAEDKGPGSKAESLSAKENAQVQEIHGVVLAPDGTPASNVSVGVVLQGESLDIWNVTRFSLSPQPREVVATDKDGRFQLPRVSGSGVIFASGTAGFGEISLLETNLPIQLKPWGKIAGRYAPGGKADGKRYIWSRATLEEPGRPTITFSPNTMTNGEGQFVLNGVPAGINRLFVQPDTSSVSPGSWAAVINAAVTWGKTTKIDLARTKSTVRGHFEIPKDTAALLDFSENSSQIFEVKDSYETQASQYGVRFGADGIFEVKGIPPGKYELSVDVGWKNKGAVARGGAAHSGSAKLGSIPFQIRSNQTEVDLGSVGIIPPVKLANGEYQF